MAAAIIARDKQANGRGAGKRTGALVRVPDSHRLQTQRHQLKASEDDDNDCEGTEEEQPEPKQKPMKRHMQAAQAVAAGGHVPGTPDHIEAYAASQVRPRQAIPAPSAASSPRRASADRPGPGALPPTAQEMVVITLSSDDDDDDYDQPAAPTIHNKPSQKGNVQVHVNAVGADGARVPAAGADAGAAASVALAHIPATGLQVQASVVGVAPGLANAGANAAEQPQGGLAPDRKRAAIAAQAAALDYFKAAQTVRAIVAGTAPDASAAQYLPRHDGAQDAHNNDDEHDTKENVTIHRPAQQPPQQQQATKKERANFSRAETEYLIDFLSNWQKSNSDKPKQISAAKYAELVLGLDNKYTKEQIKSKINLLKSQKKKAAVSVLVSTGEAAGSDDGTGGGSDTTTDNNQHNNQPATQDTQNVPLRVNDAMPQNPPTTQGHNEQTRPESHAHALPIPRLQPRAQRAPSPSTAAATGTVTIIPPTSTPAGPSTAAPSTAAPSTAAAQHPMNSGGAANPTALTSPPTDAQTNKHTSTQLNDAAHGSAHKDAASEQRLTAPPGVAAAATSAQALPSAAGPSRLESASTQSTDQQMELDETKRDTKKRGRKERKERKKEKKRRLEEERQAALSKEQTLASEGAAAFLDAQDPNLGPESDMGAMEPGTRTATAEGPAATSTAAATAATAATTKATAATAATTDVVSGGQAGVSKSSGATTQMPHTNTGKRVRKKKGAFSAAGSPAAEGQNTGTVSTDMEMEMVEGQGQVVASPPPDAAPAAGGSQNDIQTQTEAGPSNPNANTSTGTHQKAAAAGGAAGKAAAGKAVAGEKRVRTESALKEQGKKKKKRVPEASIEKAAPPGTDQGGEGEVQESEQDEGEGVQAEEQHGVKINTSGGIKALKQNKAEAVAAAAAAAVASLHVQGVVDPSQVAILAAAVTAALAATSHVPSAPAAVSVDEGQVKKATWRMRNVLKGGQVSPHDVLMPYVVKLLKEPQHKQGLTTVEVANHLSVSDLPKGMAKKGKLQGRVGSLLGKPMNPPVFKCIKNGGMKLYTLADTS